MRSLRQYTSLVAKLRRRCARVVTRLCALVAMAVYLVGAVGVPVYLPGPTTADNSLAFPCQGRGCGCQTAAQCWRGCCCFTARERLNWADRHRVQLDGATRFALLKEAAESDVCHSSRSCCSRHGETADHCDEANHGNQARRVSKTHESKTHHGPRHRSPFLSIAAAHCHSLDSYTMVISAPTLPLDVFCGQAPAFSETLVQAGTVLPQFDRPPPVPPPRLRSV